MYIEHYLTASNSAWYLGFLCFGTTKSQDFLYIFQRYLHSWLEMTWNPGCEVKKSERKHYTCEVYIKMSGTKTGFKVVPNPISGFEPKHFMLEFRAILIGQLQTRDSIPSKSRVKNDSCTVPKCENNIHNVFPTVYESK